MSDYFVPAHLKLFGKGIYDLHITVDEKQIYDVILFSRLNNLHLAFACGNKGVNCRQLMTSQHIEGTAESVLHEANIMTQKMCAAGISVVRVKIEAMANAKETRAAMEEFMKTKEFADNTKYSFEFHYKVVISSDIDQQALERLCREQNVSYAVNVLSKKADGWPLISHRIRADYESALVFREHFRSLLMINGISCLTDGTHYEAIIYDSNYALDNGFVPEPKTLRKEEKNEQIF